MTEKATVLTHNGDKVLLGCSTESAACKSCAGSPFCNVHDRTYEAILEPGVSVCEGEVVRVYLPPGRTIFAGFMVLIVPLLLFLLFFLSASRIFPEAGEGKKALLGILGLAAGFGISFLFSRVSKKKNMPRVIGKA